MNHEPQLKPVRPAIIVHGGAHAVPPREDGPHRQGCLMAANAGWEVLQRGGSALDAVEAAVRVLEDDPTYNAGTGSVLNLEGQVEMDAAIMDGSTLEVGGVGALQGVRHAVSVARRVMEIHSILLVGEGARRFAESVGAELCDNDALITSVQRERWQQKKEVEAQDKGHDTVGAVAIDANGHLAVATSTGGIRMKLPGRVGDSPIAGSGFYADDEVGACALTGDGESIARVVSAKAIIDAMHQGVHPDAAIAEAMEVLGRRAHGKGGAIAIDRFGRIGWEYNAANLPVAYMSAALQSPKVFTAKSEE